jgi:hypothetical protein
MFDQDSSVGQFTAMNRMARNSEGDNVPSDSFYRQSINTYLNGLEDLNIRNHAVGP